jgi:hypothetical protein
MSKLRPNGAAPLISQRFELDWSVTVFTNLFRTIGPGKATLRDWRENGCFVLAVAEDGHLAILTNLQGDAVLRREQGGASSCALGSCSHSSRLEDATDSSNDAVPVNYDSTIECRSITHQPWREIAQWAVHEQPRVQSLDWRHACLRVADETTYRLL